MTSILLCIRFGSSRMSENHSMSDNFIRVM